LEQLTEPKNGWIWLEFGRLVPWVNTWGCVFYIFFIFIFGGLGTILGPNWANTFGGFFSRSRIRFDQVYMKIIYCLLIIY